MFNMRLTMVYLDYPDKTQLKPVHRLNLWTVREGGREIKTISPLRPHDLRIKSFYTVLAIRIILMGPSGWN
jgi:hypothetical protein